MKTNTNEGKALIEQAYPSVVRFNLEVTGNEPLPRSTNISEIRWGGAGKMFVEFFGYQRKDGSVRPNTGYVYDGVPVTVWQDIVAGVEAPDLGYESERRSSGRVFYDEIRREKAYDSYERVF